jgi:hypothetical protein
MFDKHPDINFYGCNFYFIFNGENMATLTEIVDGLNTVLENVQAVDLKLDDIRALIAQLQAGTVSQEQIDALALKVNEIKAATAKVLTEANEAV